MLLSGHPVSPPQRAGGRAFGRSSSAADTTRGAAAATATRALLGQPGGGAAAAAGPSSSLTGTTSLLVSHLSSSSSSSSDGDALLAVLPTPLAEPLAYVKALTTVLGRQAAEAALDAAASISVQLAEQPQRLATLQAEVEALAQSELAASGNASPRRLLTARSSASTGSSSGGASSSGSGGQQGRPKPQDLATIVDELRADIAASRSLITRIRLAGGSAVGSGAAGGASAGAGGGRPAISSR